MSKQLNTYLEMRFYKENNRLIAEFMDRDKAHDKRDKIYHYHSSWDWLMPVVEKIINDRSSCCTFSGKDYLPKLSFSMLDDERHPFQGESENSLKEACFQAVVKYIKWYNSCQK